MSNLVAASLVEAIKDDSCAFTSRECRVQLFRCGALRTRAKRLSEDSCRYVRSTCAGSLEVKSGVISKMKSLTSAVTVGFSSVHVTVQSVSK